MAARFNETGLGNYEICYIRDREKREVDFVLVKDSEPIALFESRPRDTNITKSGTYYGEKLNLPLFQVVRKAKKVEMFPGNRYVVPAVNLLMLIG